MKKILFLVLIFALPLASLTQADEGRRGRDRRMDVGRARGRVVLTERQRHSFAVARARVVTVAHPRWWWRSRFHTRFVLFGDGWYYWDAGYWFPAYGYDPAYSYYPYSEPIYGYNNLAPGQVLENVQVALRDQGFYRGAIDGQVGPQTRAALAAYQRANGLDVTAAVDEATLRTLGLA